MEAFETGTVLEVRYKVGDMAIVLEPIIMVGEEGEVLESVAPTGFAGEDAQEIVSKAGESDAATPVEIGRESETVLLKTGTGGSSPLARRLAGSAGLNIAQITGTGPAVPW